VKRRDLIRHLMDHGCELVREGGSHSWWGNPALNRRSAVPRHREVSGFLAAKICRDLGIPDPNRRGTLEERPDTTDSP
jgi:mRNA interferase HicA